MKSADYSWLTDHWSELFHEYEGKWIAVAGCRVVGVGDTATQAAERAQQQVSDGEYLLEQLLSPVDLAYVVP